MKLNEITRPSFSEEEKLKIFAKTDGHCHLCNKKLARKNYGKFGQKAAWEIDHSKPLSKGGSNHLNNYQPACISCNRSKGNSSNDSIRKSNGLSARPKSKVQKKKDEPSKILKGAVTGAAIGSPFGIAGAAIGSVIGAVVSSEQ